MVLYSLHIFYPRNEICCKSCISVKCHVPDIVLYRSSVQCAPLHKFIYKQCDRNSAVGCVVVIFIWRDVSEVTWSAQLSVACVALCTGGRVSRVRARGPQFLDVRVCGVDAVLAMFGRLAACDVTLARTLKVASAVLVIAVSMGGGTTPALDVEFCMFSSC